MAYTVLARKYRPQTFADLVGQEHVTRTLSNAIRAERVAHAFLFTGVRGVGKTTTARIVAKALNCERGPTPEPCGVCDPCRDITAGRDTDVLEMDGASNNSVEDVRRLQESIPYRPTRDRFKIVIVDEVHMLSTGAFNAFLKTLEEPPPHVKFIFATTEVHKVPVTIRSRCQRYDFRMIPQAVVSRRVREILAAESLEADDAAVGIVAREAAGSMRDALTLLDQIVAFGGERLVGDEVARVLGIADRDVLHRVARAVLEGDGAGSLVAVDELASRGLDMLHFARQLLDLVRDMVVLRVCGADTELCTLVEEERVRALDVAGRVDLQELQRAFSALSKVVEDVGQSGTPRTTLEMGLVRLATRPPLRPLAELIARLEEIERRTTGGSGGGGSRRGPPRGDGGARPSPPGGARASEDVESASLGGALPPAPSREREGESARARDGVSVGASTSTGTSAGASPGTPPPQQLREAPLAREARAGHDPGGARERSERDAPEGACPDGVGGREAPDAGAPSPRGNLHTSPQATPLVATSGKPRAVEAAAAGAPRETGPHTDAGAPSPREDYRTSPQATPLVATSGKPRAVEAAAAGAPRETGPHTDAGAPSPREDYRTSPQATPLVATSGKPRAPEPTAGTASREMIADRQEAQVGATRTAATATPDVATSAKPRAAAGEHPRASAPATRDRDAAHVGGAADERGGRAAWERIAALLMESKPALGAVLHHGAPVEVSRERIVLAFEPNSFFGKQVESDGGRQAIAESAARVLGARPRVEVLYSADALGSAKSLAQEAAEKRDARLKATREKALAHPLVAEVSQLFDIPRERMIVRVELEN